MAYEELKSRLKIKYNAIAWAVDEDLNAKGDVEAALKELEAAREELRGLPQYAHASEDQLIFMALLKANGAAPEAMAYSEDLMLDPERFESVASRMG